MLPLQELAGLTDAASICALFHGAALQPTLALGWFRLLVICAVVIVTKVNSIEFVRFITHEVGFLCWQR